MITKPVQNLFDFIDYLYSQTDYFLSQQHLVDEVNEIRAEQNKLRPTKHFKDKAENDRLQNLFLEKLSVIEVGIIVPIREKIEFYDIADISTPIVNLNALGDLLELQRNFDEQDLLKIQKAKNQYIIYRIKTRWQGYFSFGLFFSDLDRELYEYFKFFEEDNEVEYISDKTVKVESWEDAILLLAGKTKVNSKSLAEAEPPRQSRTSTLICDLFEQGTKNGWQDIFSTEVEYQKFVNILTDYFEYQKLDIDDISCKLKRSTKTRTASILSDVHRELSDKPLKSDFEFFRIIRILEPFKDVSDNDIYKALTK